ncbi:CRISPR-associated protein Cas4 [Youngiibacter fragilis]|uniref:CRISPR-associated exonuclease Cas4 n=1 Tax=Youngiibacter fragilis 232.1 TaxID=994573 RepID=V7I551_9CLOT|nr:CRISPR-associated protein Cas4 [Youngiibacter fragilis]ETA80087.1 CRISPR-associated protein Cas4 [Youngiibacter fragilis 232.1]
MDIYSDEDLIQLSGIQHIAFCERQWSLIYLEQVWTENIHTLEGKYQHERVDDPYFNETRNDIRIVRSMPLVSRRLGLTGIADVVEFKIASSNDTRAVKLPQRKGLWLLYPVEHKKGHPKPDDRDAVQLCAQAMALEEMFGTKIEVGYLFYNQTRHRVEVVLNDTLRDRTIYLSERMHSLLNSGITSKAIPGKHCSQCSLKENCLPELTLKHHSINDYLARMSKLEEYDS